MAKSFFNPTLKPNFLLSSSITYTIVFTGVLVIFSFVEIIRHFNIWSSTTKELLLEYHKTIITALGFISGSFFVMITILWSRDVPLPKLRYHTYIGFLFLSFILINGYDLLSILQKKINRFNPKGSQNKSSE